MAEVELNVMNNHGLPAGNCRHKTMREETKRGTADAIWKRVKSTGALLALMYYRAFHYLMMDSATSPL
jgi:hypothetical protein